MNIWANVITTFASCFAAGMIFINVRQQIKLNAEQNEFNRQQDEINMLLHARIANLERQVLPEHELREENHVH